jgi:hypothetical protein
MPIMPRKSWCAADISFFVKDPPEQVLKDLRAACQRET